MKDPAQRNFDLFLVNLDGTGLEQVTYQRDIRRFSDVLAGRQEAGVRVEPARSNGHETNIFIADWQN